MATRIDVLTHELHELIDLIVCNHVRSEGVAVQIAALSFALRNIKYILLKGLLICVGFI